MQRSESIYAVTWSDDAHFPLVQGTVLSALACAASDLKLACLDVGLGQAERDWLTGHNVRLLKFDRAALAPFRPEPDLPNDAVALLARPFLPTLLPDATLILWVDCAVWFQTPAGVREPLAAAAAFPGFAAVPATVGFGYGGGGGYPADGFIAQAYGAELAARLSGRPMLNASLFAISAPAPLWAQWAAELPHIHGVTPAGSVTRHAAEQTALNRLVLESGQMVPLPHNHLFQCHIAIGLGRRDNQLCLPYAPYAALDSVYLADPGRNAGRYLAQGMLYQGGTYLTADLRTRLAALRASWG